MSETEFNDLYAPRAYHLLNTRKGLNNDAKKRLSHLSHNPVSPVERHAQKIHAILRPLLKEDTEWHDASDDTKNAIAQIITLETHV